MPQAIQLRCDGCGQKASGEHMERRLRRLEWATRYRPVHISNLFLGAFSPREDRDFLYSPNAEFGGEAGQILKAVGIEAGGRTADAVMAEFQRAGFFLTHVLECPFEDEVDGAFGRRREAAAMRERELLRERLAAVASLVRRSFKPRRVILVTEALEAIVQNIVTLNLGCPVILNDGKPFVLSAMGSGGEFLRFRGKLAGAGES